MPSALLHVAWERCLLTPRRDGALESYARRKMGIVPPGLPYFVDCPWAAKALLELHPEQGLLMHLDLHLADLISLVVSQENSCRYCYAAVRALLRIQGMSEARIQRLEQDLTRAELDPRTIAAITYARAQSRTGVSTAREARRALLEAGFSTDETKEIAFVVATLDFLNRASTIPAIPSRDLEEFPDKLHTRLFRPLIARMLEGHRFRGRPAPLTRVPAYPYAALVKAFSGSPIATVLADTLEGMWASTGLSRRAKLLLFAVIARGLGCECCEEESSRALCEAGFAGPVLARILTHLDAPELTAVERVLVPFARETIWYEPAPLQRRARSIRDQLSASEFLEAVGVLSLANGLCRLGAAVADGP